MKYVYMCFAKNLKVLALQSKKPTKDALHRHTGIPVLGIIDILYPLLFSTTSFKEDSG